MRRITPLVVACMLVMGLAASLPGRCLACSCAVPASLAEAVQRSPGIAVFFGTIVAQDDESGFSGRATMRVEGRFRGPLLPATVDLRVGGGGDCSISVATGARMLVAARLEADGRWFPALCDPQGELGVPDGEALYAEAVRTFGSPQPVGSPPVAPAPGGPDPVALAGAAAVVLALAFLLVVGVTLAARRARGGA
ncbi:MAG: hypothetical protein ABIG85_07370 [Chloroflexota bacterium]